MVRDKHFKRDKWSNNREFALSCMGYCIGLGNIWRFPYLCYRNGGGAFLLPYILMVFAIAMPVYFLELAIGQFMRKGPIKCFNLVPIMKGVGMASGLMTLYLLIYYIMVIAWALVYFFRSFTTGQLPWNSCGNWWNSDSCIVLSSSANFSTTNFTLESSTLSVVEFYNNYVLRISRGIEDIGSTSNWQLMLCFLLAWTMCYFTLFKGMKLAGKVVYFTVLFPYVILFILLLRGCTLPGAGDGLAYFLKPNFTRLADSGVWRDAAGQVIYSYGVFWGVLMTFGSYNNCNTDCLRYSVILTFLCGMTSIVGGVAVFSVLGHMAFATNKSIAEVASSGPGLVFQAYPAGLSLMPGNQIWSLMFFCMIILIGIDTVFASVEAILAVVGDFFPEFAFGKRTRKYALLGICLSAFIPGFPITFGCGIYIFELFNTYAVGSISLFTVAFFECITFAYMYGINKLFDHFKIMIGYMPCRVLKISYLLLTPLITFSLVIFTTVYRKPLTIDGYVYPAWAYAMGWCLGVSSILLIPGHFIYYLVNSEGRTIVEKYKNAVRPIYSKHQLQKQSITDEEKDLVLVG